MTKSDRGPEVVRSRRARPQAVIALGVVAVFVALLVWKTSAAPTPASSPSPGSANEAAGPSMVRDDPVAAYEAALKTGLPVYVLFHSLTCQPCIEISAVVDEVVPTYEGKIVFVNAITDDPGAQQLAGRFAFQYIPTSFFIDASGEVVDSHTGVLAAEEMAARLDTLVAE